MTHPRVGDPTTVTLKPSGLSTVPQPLCPPTGGPVMVYNADLVNVIYVGYQPQVTPANGTAVQPLTPVVMSGHKQLYGYNGNNADVQLNVTPGGTYQAPSPAQIALQINALGLMKDTTGFLIKGSTDAVTPAVNAPAYGPITTVNPGLLTKDATTAAQTTPGRTIANDISLTGAPLIHNNTHLVDDNFTFGAVGQSHVTPVQGIGQICYELYLSLQNALPAGSASYVQVTMDWFDSGTGLQLARRRFKLVSGSNANPHTLKISGPVHGNQVRTSYLLISDSVNLVTVASTLFGTSRLYQRDVMRTTLFGSDGFTAPGNIPEYDVLINTAPLVAANNQQSRLMAPYSGLVHCMGFSSSGTSDMIVAITEAFTGAPILTNQQTVAELVTNSRGFFDQFVALPHVQCLAVLQNANAAQQTLSFTASIQEPAN